MSWFEWGMEMTRMQADMITRAIAENFKTEDLNGIMDDMVSGISI